MVENGVKDPDELKLCKMRNDVLKDGRIEEVMNDMLQVTKERSKCGGGIEDDGQITSFCVLMVVLPTSKDSSPLTPRRNRTC